MQNRSELHIVIPGICGPLAETQSLKSSDIVNTWIKFLSKSRSSSSQKSTYDVMSSLFGLRFESGFPSATLTLMANGMVDPALFYMHADPVHLQADMDHALLTSSVDLNITEDESAALIETLNQHFNQDDLTFILLDNNQWFVSCDKKIDINTTSLVEATGRNINFLLPDGEDAVRWKQVLTEAQMLMHAHEVNASRENSALMSINSLWLHGAGEVTGLDSNKVSSLCSNDEALQGLSKQAKCDFTKVPASASEYITYLLSCNTGSVNLIQLTDLEHLINYTDVNLWSKQLEVILNDWLYPLLDFAHRKNIKVTLYPCDGKKYHFSKYDNLKFWRNDILEKHISSY